MSSMADMPVMSSMADKSVDGGELMPTPPAAGSIATDTAIRSARMVRPMRMDRLRENSRFIGPMVK